jgi:malate dehydrogenase
MTRLDHNRALSQLAEEDRRSVTTSAPDDLGQPLRDAVPRLEPGHDRRHARPRRSSATALAREHLHPDRRQARRRHHRGARQQLGRVGGERRDRPRLQLGQRHAVDDWTSSAIMSDGSYGVPEGLISSFPCTSEGGSGRSCRAWRSTTSRARRSTRRWPSSRGARRRA